MREHGADCLQEKTIQKIAMAIAVRPAIPEAVELLQD